MAGLGLVRGRMLHVPLAPQDFEPSPIKGTPLVLFYDIPFWRPPKFFLKALLAQTYTTFGQKIPKKGDHFVKKKVSIVFWECSESPRSPKFLFLVNAKSIHENEGNLN